MNNNYGKRVLLITDFKFKIFFVMANDTNLD